MCNAKVSKYLSRVIDNCSKCAATAELKPPRKVSLSSMSGEYNNVVCVDHLHLGGLRVFHIMDSVTQ